MTTDTVRDNAARSRFELDVDGGVAFINYTRTNGARVLTHSEVPVALRGRGIGLQLVAGTLQMLRAQGEKLVPRCAFVVHFIERHREYADLLAPPAAAPSVRR